MGTPTYQSPEGVYVHHLFFNTFEEAEKAMEYGTINLDATEDSFVDEDTDETVTWEYRMYTKKKLDPYDQHMLIRAVRPSTYSLNYED